MKAGVVKNTDMKMRFFEIGRKATRNGMELGKCVVNADSEGS